MPSCVMRKCGNNTVTKRNNQEITFHSFPCDEDRRQKWINIVRAQRNEEDWMPSRYSQLCSKHFLINDLYTTAKGRRRLKNTAVPIFKGLELRPRSPGTPTSLENVDISDLDYIFDTPHKFALESKIGKISEEKERILTKNTNLIRKNERLRKKFKNAKNTVDELKKKRFISEDQFTELNLRAEAMDLYNRVNQKKKSPLCRKKIFPALRKFALTLNFYSSSAYKYARHVFKALPSPKVLAKWYENNKTEPGFTKQALEILNKKFLLSGKRLICSLKINEIALRHQTSWNGKKTEGIVDHGAGFSCSNEIATQSYMFTLVCMHENWNIPVAYFLVNNLPAESRANLITICLRECYYVGVDVVAITFEGSSANINAANILGCELNDPYNLKTTFKHPECDTQVAIILDPCHMMKLIRNTFETKRLIFDLNNNEIRWQFLINLIKLQMNENLNFSNKISLRHLYFRNEISKVKLTTQVLSMSVANALKLCDELLTSSMFKDTHATIEFIENFNHLFDIFNSWSFDKYGFKRPICPENANGIYFFFEKVKQYILSLRIYDKTKRITRGRVFLAINKKKIVESKAKTGFIGFLICIESLKHLYSTLVEKDERLRYIATYRFSQHHTEIFFRDVRKHRGYDNPNVEQFKRIYKKMLQHLELRSSFTGNCVPLESYPISHCSSAVTSINCTIAGIEDESDILFETKLKSDWIAQNNIEIFASILDSERVTKSVKQIVGYLAGWIARNLVKLIKCEVCLDSLYTNEKIWFHKLITLNNMGGLCFPSEDLYKVCLQSEMIIKKCINENETKFSSAHVMVRLRNRILESFLNSNVFQCLEEHSKQQPPTFNHRLHVIRAILEKYVKVRLHHMHKNNPDLKSFSKQQKQNKLNLFEGK